MKSLALALLLIGVQAQAFTLGSSTRSDMLGWNKSKLAVLVNSTSCSISASAVNDAINSAAALWNSAPTSGLTLELGGAAVTNSQSVARNGTSGEDGVIALCDPTFGTDLSVDPNVIPAVGGFTLGSDGHIATGFLILNSQSGANANISNFGDVYLAAIVAHEIGHAIGLGHSDDSRALMYYSANRTSLRLAQDDIDGVTFLYPRKELGGNSAFGCGTLQKINPGPPGPGLLSSMAFVLALYAIARGRRRIFKFK